MKRRTKITIAVAALLVVGQALAQTNRTAEVQFKAAQHKEQVEGDLKGAIEEYKKLADGTDRSVAARSLISLAECYEKLGQADARKAYERVVRDFADQTDLVTAAQARLRAIYTKQGVANPAGALIPRLLISGADVPNASITEDGRWMVTTHSDSGGDIAVRNMLTGQVTPILDNRGSKEDAGDYAESPVLSPSLREIAYIWWDSDHDQVEKTLNLVPHEDRAQIRIIANKPGSNPRTVVSNREYQYFDMIKWSNDGRSVLAKTWKKDVTSELAWISASDGKIRVIKSLEWKLRGRANDSALSPDGKYIAYSAWANSPGPGPMRNAGSVAPVSYIYLLASDGSGETVLTQTAALNESPIWSPDGRYVLFISNNSGTFDLWGVAVRNGKSDGVPFLVKRDVGKITPKVMTRSGAYYYSDQQIDVEQVYIADLSTVATGDHSLLSGQSFVGMNPSWSPDGKLVAFSRHSPGQNGNYDLVVRDLKTQQEKVYGHSSVQPMQPRWFHNGSGWLQLIRSGNDAPAWYFADLKTGEFKRVITQNASHSPVAALSSDNKTLYVAARDPNDTGNFFDRIVAIDVATGQEKPVLRIPGSSGVLPRAPGGVAMALSPDGRTLALMMRNPATPARLALVGIDGSNYREIYTTNDIRGTVVDKLAWTPDGRSILFAMSVSDRESSERRIMRISADGGKPESIGLQVNALSTFDISPDSMRIVVSTTDNRRPALRVIDNLSSMLNAR